MKIKSGGGLKPANLFFIELIIILLFFSFSSAVILQIFAAADHRQELSDVTEGSVICAQSMAEVFSVRGSLSEAAELVLDAAVQGENAEIKLDDNFKASENGRIILLLTQRKVPESAGVLSYLNMSFSFDEKEIYSLTCTSYIPDGGDSNG